MYVRLCKINTHIHVHVCYLPLGCYCSVQVGVALGTAIMSDSWVTACWERRHEVGIKASQLDLAQYKQLPFTGCIIAFHGFPGGEEDHMTEIASSNGGSLLLQLLCVHSSSVVA